MKADLSHLDFKYRAKRSGQSPIEYACAIRGYRARRISGWAITISLLLISGATALFIGALS